MSSREIVIGVPTIAYKREDSSSWDALEPTTGGVSLSTKALPNNELGLVVSCSTLDLKNSLCSNWTESVTKVYSLFILFPPDIYGHQACKYINQAILHPEVLEVWSKQEVTSITLRFIALVTPNNILENKAAEEAYDNSHA